MSNTEKEIAKRIVSLVIAKSKGECLRLSKALDNGGNEYIREANASQCAAALGVMDLSGIIQQVYEIIAMDFWAPIDSAPYESKILVTGFSFGKENKPRFYLEATRYNDGFYSVNDDGEEYEVGFLTHWIPVP